MKELLTERDSSHLPGSQTFFAVPLPPITAEDGIPPESCTTLDERHVDTIHGSLTLLQVWNDRGQTIRRSSSRGLGQYVDH